MPKSTGPKSTLRQRAVRLTDDEWELAADVARALAHRKREDVTRADVLRRGLLLAAKEAGIAPGKTSEKSSN